MSIYEYDVWGTTANNDVMRYELWGPWVKLNMIMSYEYEVPHNTFFVDDYEIMSYEPFKIKNYVIVIAWLI